MAACTVRPNDPKPPQWGIEPLFDGASTIADTGRGPFPLVGVTWASLTSRFYRHRREIFHAGSVPHRLTTVAARQPTATTQRACSP